MEVRGGDKQLLYIFSKFVLGFWAVNFLKFFVNGNLADFSTVEEKKDKIPTSLAMKILTHVTVKRQSTELNPDLPHLCGSSDH